MKCVPNPDEKWRCGNVMMSNCVHMLMMCCEKVMSLAIFVNKDSIWSWALIRIIYLDLKSSLKSSLGL